MSPAIRMAYRLDHEDLAQLLLGGEVRVSGDSATLVLAVDGIPARDNTNLPVLKMLNVGDRLGCVRDKRFDEIEDGT